MKPSIADFLSCRDRPPLFLCVLCGLEHGKPNGAIKKPAKPRSGGPDLTLHEWSHAHRWLHADKNLIRLDDRPPGTRELSIDDQRVLEHAPGREMRNRVAVAICDGVLVVHRKQ